MSNRIENDPANYHRCSAPFETRKEANASLDAFYADVKAAREKHRIGDVFIITMVTALDEEASNRLFALAHYGDVAQALHMAAYGYATERKQHQRLMERILGEDDE